MSDKSLKSKAIKIKGKEYVQVKDRVDYFNNTYEEGSIRTRLLSDPASTHYVVQAKAIPDPSHPERHFTGLSQAKLGGQGADATAALENAETSAIGRALAMMGIGVIDGIASVDELNKAGVKDTPSTPSDLKAICAIHKVEMKHYEKDGEEWWSHEINGVWCSGTDIKKNREL